MSTEQSDDLLTALKEPFQPADVFWKPGPLNHDRSKALALAYASLRAYQNRLDAVCGLDWSVSYTPWEERIIAHLTIHSIHGEPGESITRSSTGEPRPVGTGQSEKSEIAGTAAEAQAFKRACSAFGLGRYLYHLPTLWVGYDPETKQFTGQARAKLEGVVALHYQRAQRPQTEEHLSDAPAAEETGVRQQDDAQAALRWQFEQLGSQLYGDQWPQVRSHNVARITAGEASDVNELSAEQLHKLITGMNQVKRKRRSAGVGRKPAEQAA